MTNYTSQDAVATDKVMQDVAAERRYQAGKWGGAEHDDAHSVCDWAAFLSVHHGKAIMSCDYGEKRPGPEYRAQMVKVAALAVAAVEAYDRHEVRFPADRIDD